MIQNGKKFKQLINPHSHSHASLDGAATVEQIVKRNIELGATHVTLTEHGNLNSAMELYSTCHKHHVKPILGCELYVINPFQDEFFAKNPPKRQTEDTRDYVHLTVHFKDEWAWQYFCNLTPKMEERAVTKFGERKPIATLEEVAAAAGHITVCSSCLVGMVQKWLLPKNYNPLLAEKCYNMIREIAGKDDFFVEVFPHHVTHNWTAAVQDHDGKIVTPGRFTANECSGLAPDGDIQHNANQFVIDMARKYGDKIMISLDSHFAEKKQKVIQDAKLGNGQEKWKFYNELYIMSTEDAASVIKSKLDVNDRDIEEWVENSYYWASKFDNFKLPTNKDRWILDKIDDNFMLELKKRIDRHGRMNWTDPQMVERLKKEIQIMGFNGKINLFSYMFNVEEIANWCRENDVLMNVRGSAGGSLLLYVMGVSAVNPLKHGLSFERFLTAGRIKANTLPDADIDVSDQLRVFAYLEQKYGDKFCRLSTDSMLKLKSSIKDAERAIKGRVSPETETFCKTIQSAPQGTSDVEWVFGHTDATGVYHAGLMDTNDAFRKWTEDHADIWDTAKEMLGIQRQKSVHACGCIIADKPVQDYMPIIKISGTKVTGFSPKSVEAIGGVKYDILGLLTLSDIQGALKEIEKRTGNKLVWNDLPYDEKVFKMFHDGDTISVFQFYSETVIPYLKEIKPNTLDQLANVTALCRPGTLDAKESNEDNARTLAQVYVARATGKEPTRYIHQDLEPILKDTFGIQLFQEQTMAIFSQLAGYTDEETEDVRRGISKKDQKILGEATHRLRQRCLERGWSEDQVVSLIDQIMASSRYSFNKSHATSYAYVAYACQYLRSRYELEWWKAILSNATKEDLASYYWPFVSDFIELPDINRSGHSFEISGNKLVAPISILGGLGEKGYNQLMAGMPYSSIKDFTHKHFHIRVDESRSAIHTGVAIRLIASGVLDSLFAPGLNTEEKIYEFQRLKAIEKNAKKVDPVPEAYQNMTELGKYMAKKQLIPIFSRDLRPLMLGTKDRPAVKENNIWKYKKCQIVDGSHIQKIKEKVQRGDFPYNSTFGVVAYIIDESTILYKNKSKQATKFMADVNGVFYEEVLWPGRDKDYSPTGFKNLPVILWYYVQGAKNRISLDNVEILLEKDKIRQYNMI